MTDHVDSIADRFGTEEYLRMTHDKIAELRRLCEAATPGEWALWTSCSWRRYGSEVTNMTVCEPTTHPKDGHPDLWFRNGGSDGPDARFIATANPKTVAALLDEIERLNSEIERLRELLAVYKGWKDAIEDSGDKDGWAVAYEWKQEVERLKSAIRTHREQKADDRCIEDDDRLYESLGDGVKCDRRVGDKAAMLTNCARFIERRCEAGGWPTYAELEAEVERLKSATWINRRVNEDGVTLVDCANCGETHYEPEE